MFCAKCGKEIDNDAKFCPSCGADTSVGTETTYEEPAAQPVNDMAQPQQGSSSYSSQSSQTAQPSYTTVTSSSDAGSGLGLGSMICGIIGLVLCWVPFVGMVLGIIAIVLRGKAIKVLSPDNRGMATAGFIMGIIALVIGIIVTIVTIIGLVIAGLALGALGSLVF